MRKLRRAAKAADLQPYCLLAAAILTSTFLQAAPAEARRSWRAARATDRLSAAAVYRPDGAQLIRQTTGAVSAQNPAFSPDGKTLIFTEYTNGYDGSLGGVLKMPSGGGTASAVWDKFDATNVNGLASWNGPTNRIAFAVATATDNGNIATIAASGDPSTYKQVTANKSQILALLEPTYSPNGQEIVFEGDLPNSQSDDDTQGSLYLVDAQGGAPTALVNDGDNRLPVYSPDGKLILFQRRTNLQGAFHLFTIDPATNAITQVTGRPGTATAGDNCDSDAAWSPDGRWILDSACYDNIPEDNIFLVSPDGERLVRVTYNDANEDGAPAMSPDGYWIYFESHRSNDNSPSQIWRIPSPRTDGSVRVVQPSAPNAAQNPCFSPTSAKLAYTVFHSYYNNGDAGLWTLPLAGGFPTKVFDMTGHDAVNLPGSCWNATAGRIAFATDFNAINGDEIWSVEPNGSFPMRVTNHTTSDIYLEPSYSPDGSMIVFEVDLNVADDNNQRGSLFLVKADGSSAPTVLIDGPNSKTDNREPNWSPDGARVVFQRRAPGGQFQLYTVKPSGGPLTQLTRQPADSTDPSWSPDSRSVVYSSDYNPGNPQNPLASANLFVISASGGAPTRITLQLYYDGAPSWSPDGRWIAYETGVVDPAVGDPDLTSIWKIAAPASSVSERGAQPKP